jgi:SOS-response transcriptional repressor LexA
METIHSLGDRIRKVRKHFKLRQEEFGTKIGISANRVSEIEHCKGGTSAAVLMAVCNEFPVNSEWLLSGKGIMLLSDQKNRQTDTSIDSRVAALEKQMLLFSLNDSEPAEGIIKVPFFSSAVPAGVPDPASSEIEEYLDMPASWAQNKKNIYALRVNGDSMIGIGIMKGDILLVEARETAKNGQVVIASVNGEVTVKTLQISNEGIVSLYPENSRYYPIAITPDTDFRIQGIVLAAIRHF